MVEIQAVNTPDQGVSFYVNCINRIVDTHSESVFTGSASGRLRFKLPLSVSSSASCLSVFAAITATESSLPRLVGQTIPPENMRMRTDFKFDNALPRSSGRAYKRCGSLGSSLISLY